MTRFDRPATNRQWPWRQASILGCAQPSKPSARVGDLGAGNEVGDLGAGNESRAREMLRVSALITPALIRRSQTTGAIACTLMVQALACKFCMQADRWPAS